MPALAVTDAESLLAVSLTVPASGTPLALPAALMPSELRGTRSRRSQLFVDYISSIHTGTGAPSTTVQTINIGRLPVKSCIADTIGPCT